MLSELLMCKCMQLLRSCIRKLAGLWMLKVCQDETFMAPFIFSSSAWSAGSHRGGRMDVELLTTWSQVYRKLLSFQKQALLFPKDTSRP